jgi:LytS/YehU family sensor histidine kinase
LVFIVVCCSIFILVKRRIKTIQTKAALTQQLADLEMKALRSQMNPHFVFNCLSSIQATILDGETEHAAEYVDKFSLLLRTVLNQSERPNITVQEEIDYLTTYLELECFRYEDLQFTVNVANVEDAAFIHIPGMLLQPFIENAIQHGLSHKVGEKKIDVLFEEAENSIKVTIADNGIGRTASKEINKNRSLAHQSLGIKNIEDRLKILFKDDKAKVEFIDELEGTTVIIQIPIIN